MKKAIQLFVGILISAAFLYWAVQDVEFSEVWEAIQKTNWLYALLMVIIFMASFYWRTFRWQLYLEHIEKIPSWRLFGPLMVGFGFNNVFPARAGEFVRPYALMKVSNKISYVAALSSLLVERIADVVTLLALLIAMPLYIKLDPTISTEISGIDVSAGWLESNMPKLSIVAAVALVGCLSLVIKPIKDVYIRIMYWMPLIPEKIKNMLEGIIDSVSTGLGALRSPRVLALSIIHSLIIWLSVAFSFQVLSWGFPGMTLTFGEALGFLIVTCLVISLPSSPGFWGVYEAGGKVAILMMGVVPQEEAGLALTFTLVCHFLQWVPITAYGLVAAGKMHVTAHDAEVAEENAEDAMEKAGMEEKPHV